MSSAILAQTPRWAPWARTTQERPSNPAHLQPRLPWAKLAGEWQNCTWSRGGDPGQKLVLPEAPTLSLMGEGVAEKAAQPKVLVTSPGPSQRPQELRVRERRKSQAQPKPQQCLWCQVGPVGPRTGILPIMLQAPVRGSSGAHASLRHSLPERPPHGLLSAGLSPRVLAISLKEGLSLGLRAQQRCISR